RTDASPGADGAHTLAAQGRRRSGTAVHYDRDEPGDAGRPLAQRRGRRMGVRPALGSGDLQAGGAPAPCQFRQAARCATKSGGKGEGSMTRPFTLIAALTFAFMALIHVYRLTMHFQVILGSHTV